MDASGIDIDKKHLSNLSMDASGINRCMQLKMRPADVFQFAL